MQGQKKVVDHCFNGMWDSGIPTLKQMREKFSSEVSPDRKPGLCSNKIIILCTGDSVARSKIVLREFSLNHVAAVTVHIVQCFSRHEASNSVRIEMLLTLLNLCQ